MPALYRGSLRRGILPPVKNGVLVALLISLAGTAGFFAYRWQARAPAAPAVVAAAAAPPAAAAAPPAANTPSRVIPEVVPDTLLTDLAGKRHSLREQRGHPVIYNFWATWCAPCRREIPLLNALYREHAAAGLQIVGIAIDFRDEVVRFQQSTRFDYPLRVGEQDGLEAAAAFGMDVALPFSVFADSRGRILAVKVGELHRDDADVIIGTQIAVDAGKLSVADARQHISARLAALAAARSKT